MRFINKLIKIALPLSMIAGLLAMPVQAHHSFAMYDMRNVKVFTGVVTRVDPAANHLAIFFAPMNEERTNVLRDENGEPIMQTVVISTAIDPLPATIQEAVYDEETGEYVGVADVPNPSIVQDDSERAAALAIVDSLPDEVKAYDN